MSGSLLVGQTFQAQQQNLESSASTSLTGGASSQRPSKEKPYFSMRDERKPVYAASSTPISAQRVGNTKLEQGTDYDGVSDEDEKNPLKMPGYHSMIRRGEYDHYSDLMDRRGNAGAVDENLISLAKCLVLVYEKAINV